MKQVVIAAPSSRTGQDETASCRPVYTSIIARRERNAMRGQSYRRAAYAIVACGALIALGAALVPFYHVAYQLQGLVLAAVLTPFVLYGMSVAALRGPWLLASGLVILGVTLAVVVNERYLDYDGYRSGVVYWLPLATAGVVLVAAYLLGRAPPGDEDGARPQFTGEAS